jgi:hypothetical protein
MWRYYIFIVLTQFQYQLVRRIAVHKRLYNQHGYATLKEHMPENHRSYSQQRGWDSDYPFAKHH